MLKERLGLNGRRYKYKDLSGEMFGPFTVLHRGVDKVTKERSFMTWVCECECGSINTYLPGRLIAGVKDLSEGKIFSCGCKSKLPFGVSACKAVYRQYKVHAGNRGYEFAIEWDDFINITKSDCYYCGAAPKNKIGRTEKKRGNGYYVYNGIDRMDNRKGYYLDNVVPCCRVCNRAKDVMGHDEFLNWVKSIYDHRISIAENTVIISKSILINSSQTIA